MLVVTIKRNNMYKHCNVVMLPTKSKAVRLGQLVIGAGNHLFASRQSNDIGSLTAYELYITSNEELKENDYTIHSTFGIGQVIMMDHPRGRQLCFHIQRKDNVGSLTQCLYQCKDDLTGSIIATTDPSLKFGDDIPGIVRFKFLPQPSEAFIQAFIRNHNKENIISDITVQYEEDYQCGVDYNGEEKVKVDEKNNTITIKSIKDNWNIKELRQFCWQAYIDHLSKNDTISMAYAEASLEPFNRWFNKNVIQFENTLNTLKK